MKTLKLYYSPSCAFSAGTISFLVLRGADVQLVNLDEHKDERDRLQQRLRGHKLETPTIVADDELLVAPSLSELKELLQRWGLSPDAAPHEKIRKSEN
jgi:glutaredoxin